MTSSLQATTTLNNGVAMPWLGLGVWKVQDDGTTEKTVQQAIEIGYRAIDTAAVYGNEEGVGRGIKQSGVDRNQIFVTTKIWNAEQGYEKALKAFDVSRQKLDMDVVDLLLIHWPVKGLYNDTWKALEEIYNKGQARAIGVSNFHVHHLNILAQTSTIKPMVNQVEYHPLLTQEALKQHCDEQHIQLTAWSPLMQGNLDLPVLKQLSEKYGKSPAQIVLRWDLQNGVVAIPKTITPSRLVENTEIFNFELSDEDMNKISALNKNERYGTNPNDFDESTPF